MLLAEIPKILSRLISYDFQIYLLQMLTMSGEQKEWLCDHLSHTVKTHDEFYRQQLGAVEIGKISKLLLASAKGDLSKFKSFDEITLDGKLTMTSHYRLFRISTFCC